MSDCKGCGKQFNPLKSYYVFCEACFPFVMKCKTCGAFIMPKKGVVECCGYKEAVEDIKAISRINKRNLSRAIFGGTTGNIPNQ